jgi:hypothetical protein
MKPLFFLWAQPVILFKPILKLLLAFGRQPVHHPLALLGRHLTQIPELVRASRTLSRTDGPYTHLARLRVYAGSEQEYTNRDVS